MAGLRTQAEEEFITAYQKVFDEHGNTRVCGREACKDLIKKCAQIRPDLYCGNALIGRMEIGVIQWLYNTIV